jgi:hypothetical protein
MDQGINIDSIDDITIVAATHTTFVKKIGRLIMGFLFFYI